MKKILMITDKESYLVIVLLGIYYIYLLQNINYFYLPLSDFFQYLEEAKFLASNPLAGVAGPPLFSLMIYWLDKTLPIRHAGVQAGIFINATCVVLAGYFFWKMAIESIGKFAIIPLVCFLVNPLTFVVNAQLGPHSPPLLFTTMALWYFERKPVVAHAFAVLAFFFRYESIVLFGVFSVIDILEHKRLRFPRLLFGSLILPIVWIIIQFRPSNMYAQEMQARISEIPNIMFLVTTFMKEPFVLEYFIAVLVVCIMLWLCVGLWLSYRYHVASLFKIGLFIIGYSIIHLFFPDATPRYSYPVLLYIYLIFCWPVVFIKELPRQMAIVVVLYLVVGAGYVVFNSITHRGYLEEIRWLNAEKRMAGEWLDLNVKVPTVVYSLQHQILQYYTKNILVEYVHVSSFPSVDGECLIGETVLVVVDNQSEEEQYFDYLNGVGYMKKFLSSPRKQSLRAVATLEKFNHWVKIYSYDATQDPLCRNAHAQKGT